MGCTFVDGLFQNNDAPDFHRLQNYTKLLYDVMKF